MRLNGGTKEGEVATKARHMIAVPVDFLDIRLYSLQDVCSDMESMRGRFSTLSNKFSQDCLRPC